MKALSQWVLQEADAAGEKAAANMKALKHMYRNDLEDFEELKEHLAAYVGRSKAKLRKSLQSKEVEYQLNGPDVDAMLDARYPDPMADKKGKKKKFTKAKRGADGEKELKFYVAGYNSKTNVEKRRAAAATRY